MSNENTNENGRKRERIYRQKKLGDQLRRIYDDVANEDVPDDFLKLLENADKVEKGQTNEQ